MRGLAVHLVLNATFEQQNHLVLYHTRGCVLSNSVDSNASRKEQHIGNSKGRHKVIVFS